MGRRNGKRRKTLPLILALLALLLLPLLAWAAYDRLQEEQAPQIAVPDLRGMTLEEARQKHGDNFDITVAERREGEDRVGTILEQDPSDGKAEKGSTISAVVVGTQVAEVPSVVRQGRDAAQQTLEEAGFGVAVEERESSFDEEDLVIGQTPEGGTTQEVGSEVTITVGTGPSTVKVPELYGNNTDQATGILQGVGLKLGAVSEDYSSDVLEGGIMYQDPEPGVSVEPGSKVNVTVSLGPEQVEVPDVYGLELERAQETVANAGFYYNVVEVEDNEPAGTALSTEPGAGTLVDPGATVAIYYSGGPSEPREPDRGGDGDGGAEGKNGGKGGAKGDKGGAKEDKGDRGEGRGKGKND